MLRSKKLQRKKETVVKTPTGLILTMKCKKVQVSAAKKFDKRGGFYFSFSQMAFCYVFDTFYTAYAFGETSKERRPSKERHGLFVQNFYLGILRCW